MNRRAALTAELIAVLIGAAALAIPLTAIASDRSALVRLDRRAADLEVLQNALDEARQGGSRPLPAGWIRRVAVVGNGIESVTISGPGGLTAATLRRSRP